MFKISIVALGTCLISACASTTLPMARTKSPHFDATKTHVELGGIAYAYVDIDGDAQKAVKWLMNVASELPDDEVQNFSKRIDPVVLVKILGLHNLKAIAASSTERGELFHNRMFIHHQGPRAGLLKLVGQEPEAFNVLERAPADADLVFEQDVDFSAMIDMARGFAAQGIGMSSESLENALKAPAFALPLSVEDLIRQLSGRMEGMMLLDYERAIPIPDSGAKAPFIDFFIGIENAGPLVDAFGSFTESMGLVAREETPEWTVLKSKNPLPKPWNAYRPALLRDKRNQRVFLVSSQEFLERCLKSRKSVSQTRAFKSAMRDLPSEGNSISYLSPKLTKSLGGLFDLGIELSGKDAKMLKWLRPLLPPEGSALAAVQANHNNGISYTSNWSVSHKSQILLGFASPVLISAAAAVAVPYFMKEKKSSSP